MCKQPAQKKLLERLVSCVLKRESKDGGDNYQIMKLIRAPRYKPKPLDQIVMEAGLWKEMLVH